MEQESVAMHRKPGKTQVAISSPRKDWAGTLSSHWRYLLMDIHWWIYGAAGVAASLFCHI